jgi:integrase/recombinase XerD
MLAAGAPLQLRPDMPLAQAIEIYLDALKLGGFSIYTIKAFKSDIGLLASWAGGDRVINTISTPDISHFLNWMLYERGIPCSPKSYARRVTTLKNFFGYLHQMKALVKDPSSAILQQTVISPLPEVPTLEDINALLQVTESIRTGDKPDSRPHMLVTLLLGAGIKKSEAMALRPTDIDRGNPEAPILWIRYANPQMRYKERKIRLSREWLEVFDEYMAQRQPRAEIFDCTARNLEYVLRDVANAAGVAQQKISFESLRWACAMIDYRAGVEQDKLRQKLGLSRVSWRETSSKLAQLVTGAGKLFDRTDESG